MSLFNSEAVLVEDEYDNDCDEMTITHPGPSPFLPDALAEYPLEIHSANECSFWVMFLPQYGLVALSDLSEVPKSCPSIAAYLQDDRLHSIEMDGYRDPESEYNNEYYIKANRIMTLQPFKLRLYVRFYKCGSYDCEETDCETSLELEAIVHPRYTVWKTYERFEAYMAAKDAWVYERNNRWFEHIRSTIRAHPECLYLSIEAQINYRAPTNPREYVALVKTTLDFHRGSKYSGCGTDKRILLRVPLEITSPNISTEHARIKKQVYAALKKEYPDVYESLESLRLLCNHKGLGTYEDEFARTPKPFFSKTKPTHFSHFMDSVCPYF